MLARLERMFEKAKSPWTRSQPNRSAAQADSSEPIVLSERDSFMVANMLIDPPALSKGLKKAIAAKYS